MIFSLKFLKFAYAFVLFFVVLNLLYFRFRKPEDADNESPSPRSFVTENYEISWEDWDFVKYEQTRFGPGENGQEWVVTDPAEVEINEAWIQKEGFYVAANQKMSLTRALPNHRPVMLVAKFYSNRNRVCC